MEKFNPRNPKFKEKTDLPKEKQADFRSDKKDGFIAKSAADWQKTFLERAKEENTTFKDYPWKPKRKFTSKDMAHAAANVEKADRNSLHGIRLNRAGLDPNERFGDELDYEKDAKQKVEQPKLDDLALVPIQFDLRFDQHLLDTYSDIFYRRQDGSIAIPRFLFDVAWKQYLNSGLDPDEEAFIERGGFSPYALLTRFVRAVEIRKLYRLYTKLQNRTNLDKSPN